MSDLISRQAAIDAINEAMIGKTCDTDGTRMARITNDYLIKRLPSAGPEIIRCRDCQHRDEHGCCKHWKALSLSVIPIATDDDDFCSYAERKM